MPVNSLVSGTKIDKQLCQRLKLFFFYYYLFIVNYKLKFVSWTAIANGNIEGYLEVGNSKW